MKTLAVDLIIALCCAGLLWLLTFWRRRLPELDVVRAQLTPGLLRLIDNSLLSRGEEVFSEEDDQAYARLGGFSGLRRLRRNAVLMVQYVQRLCLEHTDVPADQVAYMMSRRLLISGCVAMTIVEAAVRYVRADIPHLSARIAGVLYRQMSDRLTTICQDVAPECVPQL